MKLPDFRNDSRFNLLREKMGKVPLASFSGNGFWNSISEEDLRKLESARGLDIAVDDVDVLPDGTFEWNGIKVLVYIRDQIKRDNWEYKYHISECETLESMRQSNRFNSRYVISRNTDGSFIVNKMLGGVVVEEGVRQKMNVCKNCLKRLDYQGYVSGRGVRKSEIYASFSIEAFLKKYTTEFRSLPPGDSHSSPINAYVADWEEISAKYREAQNWCCEGCRTSFSAHRDLLEVHHCNGDKRHNSRANLKALCVVCHASMPDHKHIRMTNRYRKCQEIIQRKGFGKGYGDAAQDF